MIERRRDPNDRRRHLISITATGGTELTRLRAIVKQIEDEFLTPLDAESREQLYELTVKLACFHDFRFAHRRQSEFGEMRSNFGFEIRHVASR